MKINKGGLFKQIFQLGKKAITNGLNKISRQRFEWAKSELLREVREHAVSQELSGGPNASNITGTLGGSPGANLYSFLGFRVGSNPVEDLISFLNDFIVYEPMVDIDLRGFTQFRANIPNRDEFLLSIFGLPWASRLNWVWAIEDGNIGNLGSFLGEKGLPNSRSKGGVQVEDKIYNANMRAIPYLSPIFNDFFRKMTNA